MCRIGTWLQQRTAKQPTPLALAKRQRAVGHVLHVLHAHVWMAFRLDVCLSIRFLCRWAVPLLSMAGRSFYTPALAAVLLAHSLDAVPLPDDYENSMGMCSNCSLSLASNCMWGQLGHSKDYASLLGFERRF